jgi:hypothetical protein
MPGERTQLSPKAAVALGLFVAVMGLLVIGMAVHLVPTDTRSDDPEWLGVAAGLAFILAGAAVIVGFAVAGGAAPDGDLPPGTPFGVRLTQYLLGLGIVALLTAIAAWIAFGPGTRQFGGTGLPFLGPAAQEKVGRAAFGVGAVLSALVFALLAIVNARRLRRRP